LLERIAVLLVLRSAVLFKADSRLQASQPSV
jgi:hypothetical protein